MPNSFSLTKPLLATHNIKIPAFLLPPSLNSLSLFLSHFNPYLFSLTPQSSLVGGKKNPIPPKTKVATMVHMQFGRTVLRQFIEHQRSLSSGSPIHPLLFIGQGLRYRKLEVILTTNIEKLGKAGETVKVAPGYFRNHLMPKLLAVPNIQKYADLVKEQRKLHQPEEEETVKVVPQTKEDKMKEYQAAAIRLDSALLVLRRQVQSSSNLDELRSPVSKDELVAEVARQLSVNIQPENLYLPSPLSSFGEFEVPLLLPKSIPLTEGKLKWTLNVKLRRK